MICSPLWSFAQLEEGYVVKGVVRDAATNETLPFANVFFSGTTYGTTSDGEGNFTLRALKPGTYDLVISYTGYTTYLRQVDLNEYQELRLTVNLLPDSRNLGNVTVTAREDRRWQQDLITFKRAFLGTSKFAKSCKILNEEVLNFYFDTESNVFEAFASEPLIIENNALGYRISYLLEDFKISYDDNYSSFYGFPSFQDMNERRKLKNRWQKNRDQAYLGSISHFFKTLYSGTYEKAGYTINRAKDTEDGGRILDVTPVDMSTLIKGEPGANTKTLVFEDYLYVDYKNEYESIEYKFYQNSLNPKPIGATQLSWFFIPEGLERVDFEESGYLINPLAVTTNGYWGFERLGDSLPTDYEPLKK